MPYKDEEVRKAFLKSYYERNKERQKALMNKRYQEKGDEIREKSKARIKANPEKYRAYFRIKGKEWEAKHPGYHAALTRKRYAYFKALLIAEFGGRCFCCGETIQEFLTLDHIKGDGKYERDRWGHHLYQKVAKEGFPKDRYRLACMNCNWVARKGAVCPHQTQTEGLNPPC